jgi:twinkle protein
MSKLQLTPKLETFLQQQGWKWKPASSGNIAVQRCPFCENQKHKLWLHAQTTQFRCWACDEKGNLKTLRKKLGLDPDREAAPGEKRRVVSAARAATSSKPKKGKPIPMALIEQWHEALINPQKPGGTIALEYLTNERGLSLETLKHFKLGYRYQNRTRWIVIPHMAEGVCENFKMRSVPPAEKTFRRRTGAKSVLFNHDTLVDADEPVVCEAELDAISFFEAGVRNVGSLTCGAGSFLPEWYDVLAEKERVTLVLDADYDGQKGARDIARRVGFDKCWNVLLPEHDANKVLTEQGGHVLAASLDDAEQFEVDGVISAADVAHRCRHREANEETDQGIITPWPEVNGLLPIGGLQPGDLVTLSAKVKTGKTSWAQQFASHVAAQGDPILFYCLEMSVDRLTQKLIGHLRSKDYSQLSSTDWAMGEHWLSTRPFWYVDPFAPGASFEADAVFEKLREACHRYGVKLVVFDNLHYLCRSVTNLTQEIGNVTRQFKMFAEEMHCVVVLIAQPKKIGSDKRVMTLDDIKDSAAIPADSDYIVILHRNRRPAALDTNTSSDQEVLEPKTLVRLDAARFGGGGEALLHYDGARSTYLPWAQRPVRRI